MLHSYSGTVNSAATSSSICSKRSSSGVSTVIIGCREFTSSLNSSCLLGLAIAPALPLYFHNNVFISMSDSLIPPRDQLFPRLLSVFLPLTETYSSPIVIVGYHCALSWWRQPLAGVFAFWKPYFGVSRLLSTLAKEPHFAHFWCKQVL